MNNIIKLIENSLIKNQETISSKSLIEVCKTYSINNINEIKNYFKENKLINNKDILHLPTSLQNDFIKEIKKGDTKARDVMILTNYNLVTNIVNHYIIHNIEKDDFIGYGILGLMYAIDNYEFDNNAVFSTYATKCIIGYIKRYLPKHASQLSIGRNIYYLKSKIQKIEEELMKTLQKEDITDLEILNELKKSNKYKNLKLEDITSIRLYTKAVFSLDKEKVTEDGNDLNYTIDCVTSDKDEFESDLINKIYYETISKIFTGEIKTSLTKVELKVLWYRYGFDEENIYRTSDEVGKILKVSGSRVREAERNALRKLRITTQIRNIEKENKSYIYF